MAFNGSCNEYCGLSHANMRFRAFTVSQADFDKWAAHQKEPAAFGVPTLVPTAATPPAGAAAARPSGATPAPATGAAPTPAPAAPPALAPMAEAYSFPPEKIGAHILPKTPVPAGLTFDDAVLAAGDAQRGMEIYSRSACIGCHKITGNASSVGIIGPNLTHMASRLTIGAGLFPNDAKHLALWIKNVRRMKPISGATMPTLGIGELDPVLKTKVTAATGGLTDAQIADIVAYLRTLK
jgi:cytochrome c oxidase subunit 2